MSHKFFKTRKQIIYFTKLIFNLMKTISGYILYNNVAYPCIDFLLRYMKVEYTANCNNWNKWEWEV